MQPDYEHPTRRPTRKNTRGCVANACCGVMPLARKSTLRSLKEHHDDHHSLQQAEIRRLRILLGEEEGGAVFDRPEIGPRSPHYREYLPRREVVVRRDYVDADDEFDSRWRRVRPREGEEASMQRLYGRRRRSPEELSLSPRHRHVVMRGGEPAAAPRVAREPPSELVDYLHDVQNGRVLVYPGRRQRHSPPAAGQTAAAAGGLSDGMSLPARDVLYVEGGGPRGAPVVRSSSPPATPESWAAVHS
jgi:hypothetical protein